MNQYLVPIFSIAGILIGAFLSYLITSRIEARKWKQQIELENLKLKQQQEAEDRRWEKERIDLRLMRKREALVIILGWIEPIKDASMKASFILARYIDNELSNQELNSKYPNLRETLQPLPPHFKAFLPEQIYLRIEHLRLGITIGRMTAGLNKELKKESAGQEVVSRMRQIGDDATKLEEAIQKEYMGTFQ